MTLGESPPLSESPVSNLYTEGVELYYLGVCLSSCDIYTLLYEPGLLSLSTQKVGSTVPGARNTMVSKTDADPARKPP